MNNITYKFKEIEKIDFSTLEDQEDYTCLMKSGRKNIYTGISLKRATNFIDFVSVLLPVEEVKESEITEKQFCKMVSGFDGEEIDNIEQLVFKRFRRRII